MPSLAGCISLALLLGSSCASALATPENASPARSSYAQLHRRMIAADMMSYFNSVDKSHQRDDPSPQRSPSPRPRIKEEPPPWVEREKHNKPTKHEQRLMEQAEVREDSHGADGHMGAK